MAFAPQTFTKGGKTMIALTPGMAVDLAYNGWALQGAAPARPRSELAASLADLDGLSSTYDAAVAGQKKSKVKADGTDQTATLNAELAELYAAGGGTLVLPAGKITLTGQVVIPNDGGNVFATDAQLQPSMTIAGQGGFHSGQVQSAPDMGGTQLILTYTNAAYYQAKIVTRGLGRLTVRDLTMVAPTAGDTTPMFITTNTTVHVVGCAFVGTGNGATCTMDALVLGGTRKAAPGVDIGYDHPDHAFQGYGSVIERCYFDRVRRVAFLRSYANHIVIRDNFVEKTCGSNLANGACIEVNGGLDTTLAQTGDYCTGDQILNNYMNGLGYYHQIKLAKATRCVVLGNGSPDPQDNLVSMVRCESSVESAVTYPAIDNYIIANHCQDGPHLSEDADSKGRNLLIGSSGENEHNIFPQPTEFPGTLGNPNRFGYHRFTQGVYQQMAGTGISTGDAVFWAKRSDSEAVNPSTDIAFLSYSAQLTLSGGNSGNIVFADQNGTIRSVFENRGTKWRAVGQSGMSIDVGPSNSWLDVFAYGTRFQGQNGDPLRVRIGAGKDGIDFGASSDATVQRAAAGTVNVGKLAVTNAAAATTPGSVVKKIEVFDAAGASLGFVPVYGSIT